MESLEAYRARVFEDTQAYLKASSSEELNAPKRVTTWGGDEHELVPANAVMRPIAHIFHHAGQLAIMVKSLGKPAPGFDYPVL